MANEYLCFEGGLQTVVSNLTDCNGYIAVSSAVLQVEPTLADIFNIPLASDLQQMFLAGFSLPVIAYLTTWAFGVVINWFNSNHDY
jgi:hypothetical protein